MKTAEEVRQSFVDKYMSSPKFVMKVNEIVRKLQDSEDGWYHYRTESSSEAKDLQKMRRVFIHYGYHAVYDPGKQAAYSHIRRVYALTIRAFKECE